MIKIIRLSTLLCKLFGHKWTIEPNSKVFVYERCGKLAYDIDGVIQQ